MIQQIKHLYKDRIPNILGLDSVSKSAVMVPLVQHENELAVLFQVRGHQLRFQPGQVCFPGGRIDPDDVTEQSAAIRETCEELGIHSKEIEMMGSLDILVTTHSIIYPFLCRVKEDVELHPNPDEVAELFTIPLSYLFKNGPKIYRVPMEVNPPDDFPFDLIPDGNYSKWRKVSVAEYFYQYEDHVIWGLTARILSDFVDQLKSEEVGRE